MVSSSAERDYDGPKAVNALIARVEDGKKSSLELVIKSERDRI